MEHDGVDHAPGSARKLWRMVRAVYLVVGKGLGKHQPKLAALGVHLHHMLSKRSNYRHHGGGLVAAAREHPALAYLSALSCRSMDAVDAVYLYRPREVQFSCRSTPPHKRRRHAQRWGEHLQPHGAEVQHGLPEHGSATAVTRLFELMDVREATDDELETATPWAAASAVIGPAPRQVRITDSPFPARDEEEEINGAAVVDRRADEFITWFREQLRMQQRPATASERTTTYVHGSVDARAVL